MIPEYGSLALSIATTFALLLAICPLIGMFFNKPILMNTVKGLTACLFLTVLFSYTCLIFLFVTNDFTVSYVVQNSNTLLPYLYRIAATWNGYEGALLLWSTLLSCLAFAFIIIHRKLPKKTLALTYSVIGFIISGLLLFSLMLSNPFDRSLPYFPIDGNELNPLIQSLYIILHTPMVYIGYVGFTIVFAVACATLIQGKMNYIWLKVIRPWVLFSWFCLTIGILLGVYWSYSELQWANWWYWDPVENMTLLPWLTGTALIHSFANLGKSNAFKLWSIRFAILTFLFALIATFLVRSGVLASIHHVSASKAVSLYIIIYLLVIVVGSGLLHLLRHHRFRGQVKQVSLRTRILLSNNLLLFVASIAVFIGTFYPVLKEQIGISDLQNNASLFNAIFYVLSILFTFLLGIALFIRWRKKHAKHLIIRLVLISLVALGLALWLSKLVKFLDGNTLLGLFLATWIILQSICEVYRKMTSSSQGLQQLAPKHWGMLVAHIGVALLIFGVTMTQNHSMSKTLMMHPSDQMTLGHHTVTFNALEVFKGRTYTSEIGVFSVISNNQPDKEIVLLPEHLQYISNNKVISETAIDSDLFRDIYIVMGEQLGEDTWIVKVYIKPFQAWIWIGIIGMALGALLCVLLPLLQSHRPITRRSQTAKRAIQP